MPTTKMSASVAFQHWGRYVQPEGSIIKDDGGTYVRKAATSQVIRLDGCFTAFDLEALAVVMRATTSKPKEQSNDRS